MVGRALVVLVALAIGAGCSGDPVQPAGPVVSRAVEEPPGSNCPDGGTAVQSGIDVDGDGSLGDAEVQTTVYVCRRDRVRVVPEPAGANCADGGTAVWVGDDIDGDDVLEESEIRDVVYLCDAAHELLTRLVPSVSGAPCPVAGAIQVGHDLDDDGVLDDEEVLVTEYVCGEAMQGQMVINGQADVAFYQGVRAVVGDVDITNTQLEDVELPNLWFVGGSVTVMGNDALESLRLPQLYRVGRGFAATTNPVLAEVEVPFLRRIGSSLTLLDNGQLTALDLDHVDIADSVTIRNNAALAQLDWNDVHIGGDITISANPVLATVALQSPMQVQKLRVFDNPQLTTLSVSAYGVAGWVEVTNNAALATLRLQVGTIAGDLWIVDNPALTHLDSKALGFDRGLYHVGGDLTLRGSPISDFDVGSWSEGLSVAGDAKLANLAVTVLRDDQNDLEWVGGDLTLWDNPLLTWVRTRGAGGLEIIANPALETAWFFYESSPHASKVVVWDNAMLESFEAVFLRSVAGSVTIGNNPLLASPGLNSLQAASEISIGNNPMMPVCRILALFDRVNAYSKTQSGNDEDGVCN